MKKVKYIGFYDIDKNEHENRNYVLSATNKMNYIASAINDNDIYVEIISPSWTYNSKAYSGKKISIKENIELILSPTLPWGNKLMKILSIIFSNIWLLIYLLTNVKKDEQIIAYHSLWLSYPLYIAKKIKKFKLILEVEEIYTDVKKYNIFLDKIEHIIIDSAEQYIFCTELLNSKINKSSKPYSIIYGTYRLEEDRDIKFNDNKIHVVYGGTFDPRKGAISAVQSAEYLDDNYHIHIIGFGSQNQKQLLQDKIREISLKTKCIVTYDGLYKDEEYIKFLQKCHIGLSTQIPNAGYNETSFPSKVLSYMSNGLRVVSIRIKSLEKSKINNLLYYYDKDCPIEIANTIKNIDLLQSYDSREKLKILNNKFVNEIESLLNS